jgi:hypothetical protein
MAKKTLVSPMTVEQEIAKAVADHRSFSAAHYEMVPEPTRRYSVGEKVRLGNLSDVTVIEVLDDKSYVVQATRSDREGQSTVYLARWWYEFEKLPVTKILVPRLSSEYRQLPGRSADLDSLITLLTHGGVVFDPKYQRGYVWNEDNKDALIESVFDHLDIGSFLILSRSGYLHKGSTAVRSYTNLDGEAISIPVADDYSNVIIDGQQRLTTLVHFILDKRPYKGVYFSQMNQLDRYEFISHPVMWKTADEEDTTEKEVVRMFLQANRGVPQAPEHVAMVKALYDSM